VLLGNGDGTFQQAQSYWTGVSPLFVAAADLNGDGKLDLVTANFGGNNVSVLRGNGDGTFQSPVNYDVGIHPTSVAVADLNGDGKPDLVVTNRDGNSVSMLVGNGDGTFQPHQDFAVGQSPVSVAVGNFKGNGKPDLVTANFGGDTDAVASVLLNVTITWKNPANITYGTPLGPTQLDATADLPGTFAYTPAAGTILNPGSNQVLSVQFTPSIPNAGTLTTTVTITVDNAAPTITWANPANITYGTPLGPTQLNATADVPGTFVYTPPAGTVLGAGPNQVLSVTFTPTDTTRYPSVTKQVSITVDKATPVITWQPPQSIVYGMPLGSGQLNATANLPGGMFTYTPAAGTILTAGQNQTLSVTYTPADTANYTTATKSVLITVDKATPTITWANPANITYGTPLGNAQLNATADVPGTFAYTPPAGTVLNPGPNQVLSVAFTPTDKANYNPATKTVSITVDNSAPTITWANPANITYGTPLGPTQLNATADVPGTFVYTPPAGTVLGAGPNQVLTVVFTPSGSTGVSYSKQVAITVDPAPLTVTANAASRWYGRPNDTVTFTASYTGFVHGDNESTIGGPPLFTSNAMTNSPPGTYTITPSGLISSNYRITYVNGTLTVTRALLSTFLNPDIKAVTGQFQTYKLATVDNVDPFGTAASYTATIDWGDGTTSVGTVVAQSPPYYYDIYGGGDHAYAKPGTYTVTVTVRHKLGYTTPAVATGTAQVTSPLTLGGQQVPPKPQAFVQALYRDLLGRPDLPGYLTGLYADVLGRSPGAAELASWQQAAQGGLSRAALADAFLDSGEENQKLVDGYYADDLGRAADPASAAAWVEALASHRLSPALVDELVLASDEFFAHAQQEALTKRGQDS
jgi:hypothetical protein